MFTTVSARFAAPARALAGLLLLTLALGCSRGGPRHLATLPANAPSAILIRNVAVLDVERGEVVPQQDVLIRGQYVSEIGPGDSLAGPPDAEVIDGAGQTLMPGLTDAHTHVLSPIGAPWKISRAHPERNLESFLYCGVTTVFDTGESSPDIFALRKRVDDGELLGPRIFATGKTITAPDGHPVKMIQSLAPWWIRWYLAPRIAFEVETPQQARAAVMANETAGADFIKTVVDTLPGTAALIDPAILRSVVEEARSRNLRVVTHIGSTADAKTAAEAGASAWVHGVYMERIPDEDIRTLAAFGIPMTPTMVVFDNAADINVVEFQPTELERQVAPAQIFEDFNEKLGRPKTAPVMSDWLKHLREVRPAWGENVLRLHREGVTLLTGSDFQPGLFPGPSLHREIALLGRAGVAAADVLRAATINPARFLTGSEDPEFGTIAVGKRADLVLVEGNPLADLTAVSKIRDVIVGGRRLVRTGYASE